MASERMCLLRGYAYVAVSRGKARLFDGMVSGAPEPATVNYR
jgi:hypothetical protein